MKANQIKAKEVLVQLRRHGGLVTARQITIALVRLRPADHPTKNQDLINELEPEVLRKLNIFFAGSWVRSEYIFEGPHDTLVQAFEITNRGIQAIAEI